MNRIPFYAAGLNTINIGQYIFVNGVPCAKNFYDFHSWCLEHNIDVTRFKNWPFVDGISCALLHGIKK